jgi:hypothetical protein
LGILTQAWSPICGSIRRLAGDSGATDPLKDPTIAKLAKKHSKTPAQVVLRGIFRYAISSVLFDPARRKNSEQTEFNIMMAAGSDVPLPCRRAGKNHLRNVRRVIGSNTVLHRSPTSLQSYRTEEAYLMHCCSVRAEGHIMLLRRF